MAEKQLGFIDTGKNPVDLLAVKFFSTTAGYAAGDIVVQAGALYRAKATVSAGAFNAANWDVVWNAGNDGAGSGLDADLLDGLDGSAYLALANATGTLSDAQHGARGGGSLHALATAATAGFMTDAPSDGSTYGRKNGAWAAAAAGLPEAPTDGALYGRQSAGWAKGVKLAGDTMTGALGLPADPTTALQAATKQYVDAAHAGAFKRSLFTSTSTAFQFDTTTLYADIEVIGAGGGGAAASGSAAAGTSRAGGGGGAGGYTRKLIQVTAAVRAATKTITIGAAGTAGSSGAAGGTGGTCSYADTVNTLSCTGGVGGTSGGAGSGMNYCNGGSGGSGSGGDINTQGQPGSPGVALGSSGNGANNASANGGNGGSGPWGGGGVGAVVSSGSAGAFANGNAGSGYGSGGGGGYMANAAGSVGAGGAGYGGVVIITEYR